jgi:hypothetical protein
MQHPMSGNEAHQKSSFVYKNKVFVHCRSETHGEVYTTSDTEHSIVFEAKEFILNGVDSKGTKYRYQNLRRWTGRKGFLEKFKREGATYVVVQVPTQLESDGQSERQRMTSPIKDRENELTTGDLNQESTDSDHTTDSEEIDERANLRREKHREKQWLKRKSNRSWARFKKV